MDNLNSGLAKLQKHNIIPEGFVAPFGQWNSSLGQALEDLDFNYSSEFAIDYDDLPFYPYFNNHFSRVLQIPIHPISLGRMRRSHFNKEEMKLYFLRISQRNISLKLPIILYHHPHHQLFEVLDDYFAFINEIELPNFSMTEYATWWKKRNKVKPVIQFDGNNIVATEAVNDVFYRISTPSGEKIVSLQNPINPNSNLQSLNLVEWSETSKIRKWNWRDKLYNYENRSSQKFLKTKYKIN